MEAVESKDIIDDLSESQKIRLNESIRQSETGKCIPHDTVKAEIKEYIYEKRLIDQSLKDIKEGKTYSIDEVESELF